MCVYYEYYIIRNFMNDGHSCEVCTIQQKKRHGQLSLNVPIVFIISSTESKKWTFKSKGGGLSSGESTLGWTFFTPQGDFSEQKCLKLV